LQIIDTVVLVSSNDPTHPLHSRARQHLISLAVLQDIYVPTLVLIEYDLELKSHGFSAIERERIFRNLAVLIPNHKILQSTPSIHERAVQYESYGGYFDSLLAASALEYQATIISTDHIFDRINVPRIW